MRRADASEAPWAARGRRSAGRRERRPGKGLRFSPQVLASVGCALLLLGAAHAQKKKPPAKPIDLNTATVEQLQQLPGVGPAIAKAIVSFRQKSGPFRRVEDLLAVRGISKRKLEALRPYLTLTAAPQPPRTPPKPS